MIRPASCWRKRGVRADTHEGELTIAATVLAQLPLAGRLLTGDAQYCQRTLCQQVVERGGDYLVTVKENQPDLFGEIALLFDQPPPGEVFATAVQYDKGHGRLEVRRLWASDALAGYLDWPGVKGVCKVERRCSQRGKVSIEVRYAITSLSAAVGADHLLVAKRGHWSIENRVHYVRDVSMGEDASRIRTGAAPEVMAALRNVLLALLRQAGWANIAAGLRHYGWRPADAPRLLGISIP